MQDYEKEIEKIKGYGQKKFNHFVLGAAVGLFLPVFFLFCYWLWSYSFMSFIPHFVKYLLMGKVLAPVLSLCVVPNLGAFFLFINKIADSLTQMIVGLTLLFCCSLFWPNSQSLGI